MIFVKVFVLILLIAGVVASFTPIPGAFLSLIGIYIFWWSTQYTEPGLIILVFLTMIGILTLIVDLFSGVISAHIGGASRKTIIIASLVGIVGLLSIGPVGMLIGIPVSVLILEYWKTQDGKKSLKASIYTTVGILSSSIIQALLTGTMLIIMIFILI